MEKSEEFIVDGLTPIIPIQEQSIGEIIYQSLLSYSQNQPVLVNGHTGESIKAHELLLKTCTLAEIFRNLGYGPKTIISVCSRNNLDFFVPVIASLYIGATVAPLSFNYTSLELEHVLKISTPKIIFCTRDSIEKFKKLKEKYEFIQKIILIDTEESNGEIECLQDFIRKNARIYVSRIITTKIDVRNDVPFIMCSSGTTGLPKGVMLTHWNMATVLSHWKDPRIFRTNPIPISLSVLPFFHAYGLFVFLIGTTSHSFTVFFHSFEPNSFLESIQKYRITRLFVAPSLVVFIAKSPLTFNYDLSTIKEVLCGAAPLKKSTEEEFKRKLNLKTIRQGYGLTEASFAVLYSELDHEKCKPGSSGKVAPYIKLAIRDLETGEFLGPHKTGEICIKGETVMKGYFRNSEATQNTFNNGWLLTGDVGYYDEDKDFYITDRIKELIKYNAFQVAPAELEGLLLTHSGIADCGVVGLPNEKCGELPLAFVVKSKNSEITEEEIQDFVKGQLSPQKWLRGGVIFVDEIPKNVTGKILRKELRKMLNSFKSKL